MCDFIIATILIGLGIIAFVYQGIDYTTRGKDVNIGPFHMQTEKKHHIPLPPILGAIAPLSALVLFGGLSLGTFVSCSSAEAEAEDTGRLEQVRVGFGLDATGRVSPGLAASSFSLTDPIHLSLQVTGATRGSSVSVAVRDVTTQRIAWREERSVQLGGSYQTFKIGREIALGSYRAESMLGDRATTSRPFVVHAKLRSSR